MTAQEMLDQAIIELGNLKDGDIFIVKDLFKGHLWNKQDRSERLTLGTLFLNFVKQNQDKIEVLNKNSSGQQEYKLIKGWTFKPLSQKNCFTKTRVMELKIVEKGIIYVGIGTSGFDLCEMALRSGADIEKLASVLNQSLVD
ncbi:MAG: single-stranded DNA-binding protein [Acetatifactor sp.]|nr:single-stranded DNA-binding protein [Acetatifactor sp.]